MARYLFSVWPYTPHMVPHLSIANELVKSGHEVSFYSDKRVRPLIEHLGIRLFPFRCLHIKQADHIIFAHQKSGSTLSNPFKINEILQSWLLGTIHQQISDHDRYITEWRPDVIVCDVTMLGPALILYEKSRIPVAILGYTLGCMIPGNDTPPWGFGWPKTGNFQFRVKVKLISMLTRLLLTRKAIKAANRIRQKYQLPSVSEPIQGLLGHMPLYIMPSIPELDYGRTDLPRSVHYVGPCTWQEVCKADVHLAKTSQPPRVCVVKDTVDTHLLKEIDGCIAELQKIPVQVSIVDNYQRSPEDFRSCHSISFQPNDSKDVNKHGTAYDLVLATGATSTVIASLSAGIPMLVIPKEWERPENAQRVVESGVGMRLNPGKCNPGMVREMVIRILANTTFKDNARRISQLFSRYRGPALAADLLEHLAAGNYNRDHRQLTQPN